MMSSPLPPLLPSRWRGSQSGWVNFPIRQGGNVQGPVIMNILTLCVSKESDAVVLHFDLYHVKLLITRKRKEKQTAGQRCSDRLTPVTSGYKHI